MTVHQVLVIVPAWNEEPSIAGVIHEVAAFGFDILVVDDGSRDGTAAVAQQHGATVVSMPINLGVGAALRCGFRYAVEHGYQAVIQVDADGQHPADSIARLRAFAADSGAHLVIGSRFASGNPGMEVGRLRRLVMAMLARSATRACRSTITDATSGFRLIQEPLLSQFAQTFPSHYLGDTYEALVSAGRAGYTVREVSVRMREREHGRSSASVSSAIRLTLRAAIVAGSRLQFPINPFAQACDPGVSVSVRSRGGT